MAANSPHDPNFLPDEQEFPSSEFLPPDASSGPEMLGHLGLEDIVRGETEVQPTELTRTPFPFPLPRDPADAIADVLPTLEPDDEAPSRYASMDTAHDGSSDIFNAPVTDSQRLKNEGEATEEVSEHLPAARPQSTPRLYADLAQPLKPASEFYLGSSDDNPSSEPGDDIESPSHLDALSAFISDEIANPAPSASASNAVDFNESDHSETGSHLFADPTAQEIDLTGSGVNLMDLDQHSGLLEGSGLGSSIFIGANDKGGSDVEVSQLPSPSSLQNALQGNEVVDSGSNTDEVSGIFHRRSSQQLEGIDGINFDLPDPHGGMEMSSASGALIEYALPLAAEEDRSQLMTSSQAAAIGVPNLDDSAELRSIAAKLNVSTSDTARSRPPLPEPAPRSLVGWIGGGVAGLFAGLLLAGVAYFGGLLPGTETQAKDADRSAAPLAAMTQTNNDLAEKLASAEKAVLQARSKQDALQAEVNKTRTAAKTENDALMARVEAAKSDVARAEQDKNRIAAELEQLRKNDEAKQRDLVANRDKAAKAEQEKLRADQAALMASTLAAEREKQLRTAEARLTEAQARVEKIDRSLVDVVRELKAVNLVDAQADTATVLAQLPEIVNKASLAATSADARKAAEALKNAQQQQAQAERDASTARTELTTARQQYQQALEQAKQEVAQITTRSAEEKATLLQKLRDQEANAIELTRNYETQLAQQREEHRQQLVSLRAGAQLPVTPIELYAVQEAVQFFGSGMTFLRNGQLNEAIAEFEAATKKHSADPRPWYFLGLALNRMGRKDKADRAFQQGATQEKLNPSSRREVNDALEWVQGPERRLISSYR